MDGYDFASACRWPWCLTAVGTSTGEMAGAGSDTTAMATGVEVAGAITGCAIVAGWDVIAGWTAMEAVADGSEGAIKAAKTPAMTVAERSLKERSSNF